MNLFSTMLPDTKRGSFFLSVLMGSFGNRLSPLMSFSAVEEKRRSLLVGWSVGEEKEGEMEMRKSNIKDRDTLRNLDNDAMLLKKVWQWLWIYSARYLCKLLWLLQLTSLGKKLSMGGLAVSCPFQVAIF